MSSDARSTTTVRLYWLAIGLFTLLYLISLFTTLSDLGASYKEYQRLGFPMWAVFFNAGGKILGLIAIFYNRSRMLKHFAYAGFLYNLLLALSAHIAQWESDVLLPVIGLAIWGFAFYMDSRMYPAETYQR
jgi:hypothetical protein